MSQRPVKLDRTCPKCKLHWRHWLSKSSTGWIASCIKCGHDWKCKVSDKDMFSYSPPTKVKKMPSFKQIRVKIISADQPSWIATAIQQLSTPEKSIERMNKTAKERGLRVTYSLATEEEYWAYRALVKAAIEAGKTKVTGEELKGG